MLPVFDIFEPTHPLRGTHQPALPRQIEYRTLNNDMHIAPNSAGVRMVIVADFGKYSNHMTSIDGQRLGLCLIRLGEYDDYLLEYRSCRRPADASRTEAATGGGGVRKMALALRKSAGLIPMS